MTSPCRRARVGHSSSKLPTCKIWRDRPSCSLRLRRQSHGRAGFFLRAAARPVAASYSLGYLSEVERGEKEATSELFSSISRALDVPLSEMLSYVADRVNRAEAAEQR